MKTEKRGNIVLVDNRFRFLLGVNYWPRKTNIRMWRDWNENDIAEDIRLMKELGIRAVRFFIKNEDFADENANVYNPVLEKLDRFLKLLEENGIAGFASLIVGHMSGKNWRIPWTRFDDLYTPSSIEKTCRFIESIVRRFKDHGGIGGWILSNEISLVKRAESREEALALLRAFVKTVKSIDPGHVASSGDIPNEYMQETPNVRDLVDYVGPHLYLYDSDIVRHGYTYSAVLEMFSNDGDIPIVLEEFGFSTHQFSEEAHARFINEVLYSALAHGASGAFIWCFSDFPHESDPPYEWRPLELAFGIVRKDGSLKPAAYIVKRFSNELREIEDIGLHEKFRRSIDASIIVPFYIFRDYEFIRYRSIAGLQLLIQPLIGAYILSSAAGLQTSMIFELDVERVMKSRKLLIMSSTMVALSSTWRRMYNYVENGGNMYTSVIRGIANIRALHESPTHLWTELFGVENMLEAGSIGHKLIGVSTIEFVRNFGVFRKGDRIAVEIPEPIYTYLARPVDAEVIAVDGIGNPVIFRARRGMGSAYLSLMPIEMVLARQEVIDWSKGYHRLYDSIAIESNIERPYRCDNPEVEIVTYYGEESDIIMAVNHGYEKRVRMYSAKSIKDIRRVGGDSEIHRINTNMVELSMPKKGAVVAVVGHST
ncbi:MAG: cellulase family glycosylhydrolase [Ignisphaera sp.]